MTIPRRPVSRLAPLAVAAAVLLALAGAPAPGAAQGDSSDAAIAAVDRDLDRADGLMLDGEVEAARRELDAADARLREVHERHGAELPRGHVPLIVVEERLAALRGQIAAGR